MPVDALENKILEEQYAQELAEIKKMKEFAAEIGLNFYKKNYSKLDQNSAYYHLFFSEKNSVILSRLAEIELEMEWAHKTEAEVKMAMAGHKDDVDFYYRIVPINGRKGCQLSKEFLEMPKHARADTLFHEGFHNHCKIKDFGFPPSLEEPLANWVGYHLTIEYFEKNEPSQIPPLKDGWEELRNSYEIVNKFKDKLNIGYRRFELDKRRKDYYIYTKKDIEEFRKNTFREAEKKIKEIWGWNSFEKSPLNNAFFLDKERYSENHRLVGRVLEGASVREYLLRSDEFNKRIKKAWKEARTNRVDKIHEKSSREFKSDVKSRKNYKKNSMSKHCAKIPIKLQPYSPSPVSSDGSSVKIPIKLQ